MTKDVLQTIRELPSASIFGIYNPKKKKVLVTFSLNTTKGVAAMMSDLKDGSYKDNEMCQDYDDLQLIVLETIEHTSNSVDIKSIFRLHMFYWQNHIESIGLTHYGKRYNYINYKSRLSHGVNYSGKPVVYVNLVTNRNNSFVVGVFKNISDAKQFAKGYLDTQKEEVGYIYPVYARNNLTKEFLIEERMQLKNVFNVR